MTRQKLTDAIASNDHETMMWKSRFAAAKGAYEMGEFRQSESLFYCLLEQAKNLRDSTFATNTCHVGLGAIFIATGRLKQAREQLQAVVDALSGSGEAPLKEVCALARRFLAEVLTASGDDAGAEAQLRTAIEILKTVGEECAVPLAYTLSDLATLFITQGKLTEAKELIFPAMDLLERSVGSENPQSVRASLIYNICDSNGEEEMLSEVENGIFRMQYQMGRQHPAITRAVSWYLKKLRERGEMGKVAEVEDRFDVHAKRLGR